MSEILEMRKRGEEWRSGPPPKCTECEHFGARFGDLILPNNLRKCAVSPAPLSDYTNSQKRKYADLSREYGPCGSDAKLFEPHKGMPAIKRRALRFALGFVLGLLGARLIVELLLN